MSSVSSDTPRPWFLASPRRIGILISLVVLLLLAAYLGGAVSTNPAGNFETQPIVKGDVEETVTALGKLEPRTYVDVGAQVSGQLKRILVQPGDQVKAGDLLAEIDPQIQAAKVDADRAQLAGYQAEEKDAEAQAIFAAAQFRRLTALKLSAANRDDLMDQATRDLHSTEAKVDQVRASIAETASTLKADEAQLGYTRIFAPMSGTVLSVDAREGQTINSNYSAPLLMRIADLATLTVWTQVSEADVPRLKPGTPLYFTTLGYGDRRWTGKVRQILPAPPKPTSANGDQSASSTPVQPGPGNVVLYTALFDVADPTGELRPEMTAQVFFVTASASNVLVVPMIALSPKTLAGGVYTARVVRHGQIAEADVHIGTHNRFKAEILGGLQEGDAVVTGTRAASGAPSLIGFHW